MSDAEKLALYKSDPAAYRRKYGMVAGPSQLTAKLKKAANGWKVGNMARPVDTRNKQKDAFEIDLKLVVRKYFEAGNKAMTIHGGDPADYGCINDEDMGRILASAADAMKSGAPLDWLYDWPPQPKEPRARRAKAGR